VDNGDMEVKMISQYNAMVGALYTRRIFNESNCGIELLMQGMVC
jgi:hypothetical protein